MHSRESSAKIIEECLLYGRPEEKLCLFTFNKESSNKEIQKQFQLFAQSQFMRYFKGTPAPFHNEMIMNMIRSYRGERYINLAFRGSAKRQPLTANILTPSGFRKMGELKLGDYVIGSNGKKTQIEFMSEIVDRPIYEVKTEDGRRTECDSEHLWTVRKMTNVRNKHVTIDTQKMLDDGLFYGRVDKRCNKKIKEYKFALDTVRPVDLKKRKLEIDPYILGIILGDGSLDKTTGFTRLHFHKDDDSHYRNNLKAFNVSDTKYDKRNTNVGRFSIKELGPRIKKLGLNVNCYAKFIPEDYLFSSIEDRKAILEGLMDTDGTVNSGTPSFSTVSEKLADGVISLVRSLGGRASKKKNFYNGNTSFRVSILFTHYKPFRLERKLKICKLAKHTFSRIISIKRIENKLGRCIKVSNEDGLYVTDDFILTHNTTLMKLFVCYVLLNDEDHANRYLKILSRDIKNPRQIVTDVYNLCLEVRYIYGDVFEKEGDKKREETMHSFTMKSGVKFSAGTVGQSQRGHAQDAYRPDWIWFDDIEDRESVSSQVITEGIISRVDEAITGLAKGGSYVVTGNYISEYGVIQWFLNKENIIKQVVPIIVDGKPTWSIYSVAEIEQLKKDSEDFYGEYLCLKPDTLIQTGLGVRQIQWITVGNLVWTHLGRLKRVLKVFKSQAEDLLDITVQGKITTITKNHPVLVVRNDEQRWIPAGELTLDDLLLQIPRGKLIV